MRVTGVETFAALAAAVLADAPRLGQTRLVCVDGPAGSGKTTFGTRLADALAAPLVHMDDVYAGWTLAGATARVAAGVLRPLQAGLPGALHHYDWSTGAFAAEPTVVPVAPALVVEGCGSAPRAWDPLTTLRVWVEAPAALRLTRGLDRDGVALREQWLRWQEQEAAVFTAEDTRARADLRVDGAPLVPDRPGAFTPLHRPRRARRHTVGTPGTHHGGVTDSSLDVPVDRSVEAARVTRPAEGPAAELLPLAGYTVAVTAARRSEELGALLDRRGARVLYAPAIRIVPLSDDADLVSATREVLAAPVDLVVATTGVGFRGWLEAAEAWDLPLREHLQSARVLARGPKARGAIRGAGLVDAWSPESESSAEVLSHLLSGAEGPLPGRRIAVQLHGDPLPELVAGLVRAGAEVVKVPVYRWVLPEDTAPLRRLVTVIAARGVDAVTFTSAPAAASLLQVAGEEGVRAGVLAAFADAVLPVAVGPVTAGPLEAVGIHPVQPERARLGALAREVVAALPARHPVLQSGPHTLQVRGHAAVLDGRLIELPPGPMAVLRALARRPGVVVSRPDLLTELSGGGDAHAVEMAVTRLRAALGAPVVETVVKRGYRLAV